MSAEEPMQVGKASISDASVINRWNLVPDQSIGEGKFHVGLLAFHSYGMDRVEFSLNNGPWVTVTEKEINPRTGTEEFFVTLDGSKYSENELQLKAVAYPKHGKTFASGPIRLFKDADQIVGLDAGTYNIGDLQKENTPPHDGWLIFKPKPGVNKEDVVVTGTSRWWGGRVKFENVKMEVGVTNGFAYGARDRVDNSWFWFDKCLVEGNGREVPGSWINHNWNRTFATDSEFTKHRIVFHGSTGLVLCRNCKIHDCYEDIFRSFGLITGCEIFNINRGDTQYHPDMFELNSNYTQWNVIFHDLDIYNVETQGWAGSNHNGIAIVDVNARFQGTLNAMQVGGNMKNWFIQNSEIIGGVLFRRLDNQETENIVIRNSKLGYQEPFKPSLYEVEGYARNAPADQHPAVEIYDEMVDVKK